MRMLKSGKIFLGSWGVPCTVRSLSQTGACLQVQTTYGIPSMFELALADGKRRMCQGRVARQLEVGRSLPVMAAAQLSVLYSVIEGFGLSL